MLGMMLVCDSHQFSIEKVRLTLWLPCLTQYIIMPNNFIFIAFYLQLSKRAPPSLNHLFLTFTQFYTETFQSMSTHTSPRKFLFLLSLFLE